MRAALLIAGLVMTSAACAAPYEAMPTSTYQWERRQQRIERDWRAEQPVAPAPAAADAKDPN